MHLDAGVNRYALLALLLQRKISIGEVCNKTATRVAVLSQVRGRFLLNQGSLCAAQERR